MSGLIAKFRQLLQRVFFWHERRQSSEFTPSQAHDHALVLQVTESKKLPRWKQLRYAGLVLNFKERRVVFLTLTILVLGVIAIAWSVIDERMVRVPVVGGKITEAIVGSPKAINPLYAPSNDPDADMSALVYSGLFRRNGWSSVEPDLAERYEWSEDGKRLTITLRDGVYFHDGVLLTADDIVFTLNSAKNSDWHSHYASALRGAVIEKQDDRTIIITLAEADASILNTLTIGILPIHLWQDISPSNALLADASIRPVGTGPYRIRSFRQNSNGAVLAYTLERYDQYHGIKPYIDQIEFRFYPDHQSAEDALHGGQVDSLAFVSGQKVAKMTGDQLKSSSIELPQLTMAFLNVNDPILKDVRIREALELVVDRTAIAEAQAKLAVPIYGPYPYIEQASSSSSTEENLATARALLDASGWKMTEGQDVRTKNKNASSTTDADRLEFSITVPNVDDLIGVATALQRQWSVLGVKVELNVQTSESLIASIEKTKQSSVIVWNVLLGPTQDLYPIWWSGETDGNGLNLSGLKDKDVDSAIKAVRVATTTQAISEAHAKLSTAIISRHPAIFLTRPSYGYMHSNRIHGMMDRFQIGLPSDRFSDISNWYVKKGWRWK
jgi:peptide/nickel transport system substrate-binding protein